MLDTARLTVFAQVAANGSIAQAARDLGYTPSAVSQQLSKLEREIGAALVTRTRRGVELTAAGHVLADSVAGLRHQLAAAEQAVRDVTEARVNELRLGSFASGSLTLLAPAITRFREEHPSVRLSLSEIEPPGGYDALRSGQLDLLISHVYPNLTAPAPGTLIREELWQDPLVAVFPPSRAPQVPGPVLAEHLARIPLISGSTNDANRIALDAMFASSDASPNVDFETKDYAVTLALVAAGAGAAIVPDSVVRRMAPDLPAFPVQPRQTRRIFALRRPTAREPIVTFMACLRTVIGPRRLKKKEKFRYTERSVVPVPGQPSRRPAGAPRPAHAARAGIEHAADSLASMAVIFAAAPAGGQLAGRCVDSAVWTALCGQSGSVSRSPSSSAPAGHATLNHRWSFPRAS